MWQSRRLLPPSLHETQMGLALLMYRSGTRTEAESGAAAVRHLTAGVHRVFSAQFLHLFFPSSSSGPNPANSTAKSAHSRLTLLQSKV